MGTTGTTKTFWFCVDSFSLIGILKRGKVGNQNVSEPRQINVLLTARKVATPPLNGCFYCFFSNNLTPKCFQNLVLQKYVRLRFSEKRVSLVNLPLNSHLTLETWLESLARVIIVIYVEIRREL